MAGQISSTSGTVTKLTAVAKADLAGLMRVGKVTTATSATIFESTDLVGQDDDAFNGWYVSVLQADNAAPESEMQPMSDYDSVTGKVTHTTFTQQLAVGDWVVLLRPEIAMLGAVDTTAATGAVSTSKYLMAYVKQLVTEGIARDTAIGNIPTTMVGTDSAATVADGWDAALATILDNFNATRIGDLDELASANMPADLDTVKGLVDTAETDSSFSYLDAGGEQDVYTDAVTTRRKISFSMDISTMSQGGVVKVYLKVDGTNYKVWIRKDVDSISSGGTEDIYTIEIITNQNFKISYTEDVNEAAARAIPYSVVTQVME